MVVVLLLNISPKRQTFDMPQMNAVHFLVSRDLGPRMILLQLCSWLGFAVGVLSAAVGQSRSKKIRCVNPGLTPGWSIMRLLTSSGSHN